MQAIETRYKNYRMRSRNEARWGVFFDTLKISYEYEPEGFILDDGEPYLPDFYLTDMGLWVEIKPANFYSDEITKCKMLSVGSNKPVLLVHGEPYRGRYGVRYFSINAEPIMEDVDSEFAECPKCRGLYLVHLSDTPEWYTPIGKHTCVDHDRWPLIGQDAKRLDRAYRATRSARFEHGECGPAEEFTDCWTDPTATIRSW